MMESYYEEAEVEAAMCIWEHALFLRLQDDDTVYDWLRGGEGAASARQMSIELCRDLETSYQVAVERGYDDSFDWEFTPRWLKLAMEITEENDLTAGWLNYMGVKIYHDDKQWWENALQPQ